MKKESTRDHVDLLLSSKHWPVVFAVDMACNVTAHVEVCHPKLANALWGERRACFKNHILRMTHRFVFTLTTIIALHIMPFYLYR